MCRCPTGKLTNSCGEAASEPLGALRGTALGLVGTASLALGAIQGSALTTVASGVHRRSGSPSTTSCAARPWRCVLRFRLDGRRRRCLRTCVVLRPSRTPFVAARFACASATSTRRASSFRRALASGSRRRCADEALVDDRACRAARGRRTPRAGRTAPRIARRAERSGHGREAGVDDAEHADTQRMAEQLRSGAEPTSNVAQVEKAALEHAVSESRQGRRARRCQGGSRR